MPDVVVDVDVDANVVVVVDVDVDLPHEAGLCTLVACPCPFDGTHHAGIAIPSQPLLA